MRIVAVLALFVPSACSVANPAFDEPGAESNDDAAIDGESADDAGIPACMPGAPLQLVTFDFEPAQCSGPVVLGGMIVTQDEGAFTLVECADECPCGDEAPVYSITLHPDIPIPVFPECIVVRTEFANDDCKPAAVTILGMDQRLLVHAEHWKSPQNAAGIVVSESLMEECECETCDSDTLAPGTYALTFASPQDEVGPLRAGEMAEMTMLDDAGPATFVVKALSTAIDCNCAPRRDLQWSVTRG
jgi:hypothetical protein